MSLLPPEKRRKTGLILSGGGSRAAYQVGVLRAIANLLPKNSPNPFQIISGTSAGALNGVALAANAQRLRTGVRTLEHIWQTIDSTRVYKPYAGNLLTSASSLVLSVFNGKKPDSALALLDNTPLRQLLGHVIRFERIQRNIDLGYLDAISVTASAYSTGESVSFFQAMQGIPEWQGPHRIGINTRLGLDHLMASTAIPVIFPAVALGNQYFGDGAIRQIAPTSTAIHLGAQRILAIGVSANKSKKPLENEMLEQPSLLAILGHIMNSAFVDTLENDLEFLRHINEVVPLVPKKIAEKQQLSVSKVKLLEISPSEELNLIAMEHYDELPKPMAKYIKEGSSGTLLSLILFEAGFCKALCELGYRDAMAKEKEILDFFSE
ncbi:MAG: patatin-like phospholipase family protein [Pseudohongiellaceae bacterium]